MAKDNMFQKRLAEDRRKQFIEDNQEIAEKVLSTEALSNETQEEKPVSEKINDEKLVNIKNQEKPEISKIKKRAVDQSNKKTNPFKQNNSRIGSPCSLYIETVINESLEKISEVTGISKSKVLNYLVKEAILNSEELSELAKTNKQIDKIIKDLK